MFINNPVSDKTNLLCEININTLQIESDAASLVCYKIDNAKLIKVILRSGSLYNLKVKKLIGNDV